MVRSTMPVSPICEVREGAGSFVPTTDGVDITPGATVSVRLASVLDVTNWYLYISGTDETTSPPTLADVNPTTHKVTDPSTVVTFTMPATKGSSVLFVSLTEGAGGPAQVTFSVYTLSEGARRVGSTGETREGSAAHGWVYLVNPIIRQGASVIWYNDSLALPALGVSNVQTAVDQLKTTLRGRAISATAPADGDVYKWNSGSNQWEPGVGGGGSITLGGDLSDWDPASPTQQRVVGIDTIPAPLSDTAEEGLFVRVSVAWTLSSPRPIVRDGDNLWVAEHDQENTNYPNVSRISLVDSSLVAQISVSPHITKGIRDLAQDADYIYCAGWQSGHVAIIAKATNTIVGWGSLPDFFSASRQVTSVCADGAGNFYAVGWGYTTKRNYGIFKWSTAACLGAAPDTVAPSAAVYNADYAYMRKVRFGLSHIWAAGGQSGAATLRKFDTSLTEVATSINTDVGMNVAIYGSHVYVPEKSGDTLLKYDTDCVVVDSVSINVLDDPDGIAFDDLGTGRVLVSGVNDTDAVLVDSATMLVLDTLALPPEAAWGEMVAYNGDFILASFGSGGV